MTLSFGKNSLLQNQRAPTITLVLLPGLDGTGRLFEEFAASLSSDVDVVVANYPTDQPMGYAELEQVARRFIPADQPFVLLGESFSGPIALAIAASSPPGLLGVILCCSFARSPLPALVPLRALLWLLPVKLIPHSVLNFFLLGRFSTARLRTLLADTLSRVSPAVLRVRAHAALTVDQTAALQAMKVPLLYLRAREDLVVGKSSSQWVLARLPEAQLVEFVAPHFLLQTLPKEAAAIVSEFIAAQTRKAS